MRIASLALALVAAVSTTTFASPREPQVVGGAPVTAGQFPFLVLVANSNSGYGCTASLIRDNWILTAAHCALNGTPPNVVLLGDSHPGILGDGHVVEIVSVAQWIPHPQFNPTTLANDVALVRISVNASQHSPKLDGQALYQLTPLQLASAPATTSSSIGNVTIAGFGLIDGGVTPEYAYWAANVPTFAPSVCNQLYPPLNANQQLCFGDYPNICQGDSGGAVVKQSGQQFTQYGIVSFNKGEQLCGQVPSVATFVPGYLSWINQQIDGTTPPSSPIQYGWELPPSTANGIASGISNFQGWAFSSAGAITSVRLERNGSTVISAPCCSERGDVKNSIPGAPLSTGFAAVVNWGNLGDGTSNFTLVIRDSAGNERRETRSVQTVQILNGVPFAANLGFTNATQCNLITFNGRAGFECSGLSFQQGTCNGKITFAWLNGKQGVEVVNGCH